MTTSRFSHLPRIDGFSWSAPLWHGHKNDCVRVFRDGSFAHKTVYRHDDEHGVHVASLLNELAMLTYCTHAHIIRVVRFEMDEDVACLTLPLGTPLDKTVRPGEVVPAITSAVAYLYSIGIVHGDLRPENILLVDGQPVLFDFQTARFVKQDRPFAASLDVIGEFENITCCGTTKSHNLTELSRVLHG